MPGEAPTPGIKASRESGVRGTGGVTRLAPSPTGALHLGNARTFLVNWALARRHRWRIVLRIEDLDGPRIKPEAASGIAGTLAWLGIDWDEGPIVQSADVEPYRSAMRTLAGAGRVYPCELTRAQIDEAGSAPQAGARESRFPASLRPAGAGRPTDFDRPGTNWRFLTPPGDVVFKDAFAGPQRSDPAELIGDFVVWTKRGTPAYQLAVVVDDARQGVTRVVRGDDLLESTARQLLLYRALRAGPEPEYTHLPLVVGPDGRRLAKRHGDTRVETYRGLGVPPEAVIGLMARWCGVTARAEAVTSAGFAGALDLGTMARAPVVFTPEDDAWLRSFARCV